MELSQDLPTLKLLWTVAERTATARPDLVADYVFLPIGLRLHIPPSYGGYYSTPTNSSAFASTGGEGVHFSLVHVEDEISEQSPIVMTVPFGIRQNVIVGKNLIDFLRLGCESGYFELEKLGFIPEDYFTERFVDYRKVWDADHGFASTSNDEDKAFLKILIDEFSLTPWENVEQHLDDLHQQFFPLLKMPPRP